MRLILGVADELEFEIRTRRPCIQVFAARSADKAFLRLHRAIVEAAPKTAAFEEARMQCALGTRHLVSIQASEWSVQG